MALDTDFGTDHDRLSTKSVPGAAANRPGTGQDPKEVSTVDENSFAGRLAELAHLQKEQNASFRRWAAEQAKWSEGITAWCQEQSDATEQMRTLLLAVGAVLSPSPGSRPEPPPAPPGPATT
jgi:hypothetical protein